MLLHMASGEKRKDWREYETMEEAALRLIGVMDERAKKKALAGGGLAPAQIGEPSTSPLGKSADGEKSALGLSTLDPRRQQSTATREDGEVGSGLGMGGGCAAGVLRESTSNGCAHPAQDDAVGPTDRAENAPGFW